MRFAVIYKEPLRRALNRPPRPPRGHPAYEGVAKLIEEASVGAGIEGVNKCEAGNSPPDTGGVAAPSIKRCEATAAAQTRAKRDPIGRSINKWLELPKCFGMHSLEGAIPDHPVRSVKGGFATSS